MRREKQVRNDRVAQDEGGLTRLQLQGGARLWLGFHLDFHHPSLAFTFSSQCYKVTILKKFSSPFELVMGQ